MTSWVDVAYIVVALVGMVLSIYVMQKTEHDRINKVDPMRLQWIRRMAFIIVALALCYSILDQNWHRSIPVLLLVTAGVCNLAVNAIALILRTPPSSGTPELRTTEHLLWRETSISLDKVNAMDQG